MSATADLLRTFKPRLNAIHLVDQRNGHWRFFLTERATHYEVMLITMLYGAEFYGWDEEGSAIYKPRPGVAMPTDSEFRKIMERGLILETN